MLILNQLGDDYRANSGSTINVNVDSKLKKEATEILNDLGLNMSVAINMFLNQVVKRGGIPFRITNKKPNKELLEALEEAEEIKSGRKEVKGYHDINELIHDLLEE